MEFRINKTPKTILRPAQKPQSSLTNLSQPLTPAPPTSESVPFLLIKICDQCNLVFSNSSTLLIHLETHTLSNS